MLQGYLASPAIRTKPQVGHFELLAEIGRGSSAVVYEALDKNLQINRAVKILKDYHDSDSVEAFVAEARLQASLEHANILKIMSFDVQGNVPYFVMTLAEKGSLQKQHPLGQRLPMELILRYLKQLASGVDYLHARGILHQDLKPGNILQRQSGRLLICDLHIAAPFPYRQTSAAFLGTSHYMAPERFAYPGRVSSASDLYSIGVIIYQWLTGTYPFQGGSTHIMYQHLNAEVPSPRNFRPNLSIEVERVVLKALMKDPWDRFSSIQEFYISLRQAWENSKYTHTTWSAYPIRKLLASE